MRLAFEAREAGVYLVQVEASDRIGRRQQVSVDFFVGGDTPVTWARPPAQTATVTTDKESYAPGETATLVIQSPVPDRARARRGGGAGRAASATTGSISRTASGAIR